MIKRGILTVLIYLPGLLPAQGSTDSDSLRLNVIRAARDIISSSSTCALVTIDENGNARVRTMDPFSPDENFSVWLATSPKSRKVDEIKNNGKVSLYYSGSDSNGYVTLYGYARLVDDQTEKNKRWKEEWAEFYPNRPHDYLLIHFKPTSLEVINYRLGISGNPDTWQPASLQFNQK
jgi:general stress protein 26